VEAGLLALKLVPLLLVCSVGPGLAIVRRLQWSLLEKLCGAMGASFVLTYLASFTLYCLDAGAGAYWGVSILFALIGCFNWRQAAILLARRRSRAAIGAFAAILCWDFLHLAMIRHYGGGTWCCDWYEHYYRTRYFLHELRRHFIFLNMYALSARPPMMNLLAAYFAKQVGLNFESFSLVLLFLNAFAFLPCCLLLRHFRRRGTRCIPILAILFMLNPSVLQNVTYTWTKSMTAGFVVMGVCFYLRGLRTRDPIRLCAAALSLAAGILSHYSAGPFAAAIGIHYITLPRQRRAIKTLLIGMPAAVLLASWFGWSLAVYGWRLTFTSNSSYLGVAANSLSDNAGRIVNNFVTSIIPHAFRPLSSSATLHVNNLSDLRDWFFLMAQTTLPVMIGSGAGLVAALLACRLFFSRDRTFESEKRFWIFFTLFGFIVGVIAVPDGPYYGVAHVALQPLALIGLTLVAAWLPRMEPTLFWIVFVGLVVDYCLGIYLHFEFQSRVFQTVLRPNAGRPIVPPDDAVGAGQDDYAVKLAYGYRFWGDQLRAVIPMLKTVSAVIAVYLLYRIYRLRALVGRLG
jgi:hypothetical protein